MAEPSPGNGVQQLGLRFNVVSFLPTAALLWFVLVLIGSGAPESAPQLTTLRAQFEKVSARELATLTLGIIVVSLILHPFQLGFVRLLEGYWGSSTAGSALAAFGIELHRRRLVRLKAISLHGESHSSSDEARERARRIERADRQVSAALERLVAYPAEGRLLPTRLGNTLRSAEDEAGQRYGLATVTMWPRLYPYLSERVAQVVDDARNQLDLAVRLCVVLMVATLIAAVLLLAHGWWLLVPAGTGVLAWVAYRAAVRAAARYGQRLGHAFDLHRFDMLQGLHYPLPDNPAEEWAFNQRLSQFFAEGAYVESDAPGDAYEHPEK